MLISILYGLRSGMEDTLKIYNIDINPLNEFEFIICGNDISVKMFDKRKISTKPIQEFYTKKKFNAQENLKVS